MDSRGNRNLLVKMEDISGFKYCEGFLKDECWRHFERAAEWWIS